MKHALLVTGIFLALLNSTSSLALEKTACYMPPIAFKHKTTNDFFSDHSISIVNTTGIAQTYQIYYNHELPNITGASTKKFDVVLANGQSYSNSERFNTKLTLSVKGTYTSRATTNILLNGKNISHCESKNNVNVF